MIENIASTTTPETIGLSSDRLQRIYDFLADATASGQIPGAALLVARNGTALPPRAFGRLRLEPDSPPVQPDTIFLVASVTKPVVVTATMLLVERGLILLDDRVSTIIPEFGNHRKEKVRVRHLMTHTSGLPDMLPENRQLREQHAPLAEFVRRICQLELAFEPGSQIQYQSCGTAMLGAIIERVTGLPVAEFMRRELFDPLRMADTSLGLHHLPVERVAQIDLPAEMQGTDWGWNSPYWHNFGAPWGGMFTTVGDMAKFCQMFLNGGELNGVRILSPATIAAMTRDQTGEMLSISAPLRHRQAWGLGWRMLWRRDPSSDWSTSGDLTLPGAYGHNGATGTVVWMDPARSLFCVLLTTQPKVNDTGFLGRCSNLVAAAAV